MNVTLCREDATYVGNESLTAKWRVSRVTLDQVQAMEVSVLWHTEGKGDEDLKVHHFLRLDENQIRRAGLIDEQSLQCRLPATPLSYHGRLISVRWCARLRLFLTDGREVVSEQPFHLVTEEVAAERRREMAENADQSEISDDSQPVVNEQASGETPRKSVIKSLLF
ncbi:hypothetical protein [Planctomycetes bacterium K23_9]|uniref:Uncharacterized protein n=1 Tax=Stieleria marina TaxID=1930275 RepID=A0A517P1G7_9BACT|nr:hypothetical protein K239x_52410 [Planctomycetes bacterium K23_9]